MGSPSPSSGPKLKRSSSASRAHNPHQRTSSSITSSSCVSLESGDQDLLQYSSPTAKSVSGTGKKNVPSSPRTPSAADAASPAALKKRRSSVGGLDDLAKGLDFSNSSSSPVQEEKKLHSFLTKGGGHKKASPAVAQAASSSPRKKPGPAAGDEKLTLVAGRAALSPRKSSELGKRDTPSSPRKASPEVSRSINGLTTPKKSSPLRASLDRKLSSPRLTSKSLVGRTGELAAADALLQGDSIKKTERRPSPSPSLRSKSSPVGRKLNPSPPQLGRARTRTDNHAELSRPEMESVTVYSQYEFDRDAAKKKSDHINMMQQHDEEAERSTLLASLIQASGNIDMNVEDGTLDHEPTSWLSEDNVCMFSSLSQLPDDMSLLGDPPISSNGYLLDSMVPSPVEASNGVYGQPDSVDHELNSFCDMLDDPVNSFEAELCTERDATFESSPPVEGPVDTFEAELRAQIETAFDSPQLSVPPQFAVPVAITKGETMPREDVSSDNQPIEAVLQSCPSQDLQTGEAQSQQISSQGPSEEAPMPFLEGVEEILQLDQFGEHLTSAPSVKPIVEDEISSTYQQVVESSDDESLEDIIEDSQLNLKQSFDDVAEPQNRDVDNIDHADVVPVMVSTPREDIYAIDLQDLALSTESEFAPQILDGPTYDLDQEMKIFEEDWSQSAADESDAGQIDAEALSTAEDEAENSLPPVELPVSVLPVSGKLKVTVEESEPHATKLEIVEEIPPKDAPDLIVPSHNYAGLGATKLEIVEVISPRDEPDSTVSSDNYHAEVGATKLEIVEEMPPKDDPDSTVSSDDYHAEVGATKLEIVGELSSLDGPDFSVSLDNHHVNTTYQDEESDEVFHLYGAGSDEVILFDHLSPPSRPENLMIEDACESDSHVAGTTPMDLDAQDRDTEHQEFSNKNFPLHDTSGDEILHDSFSGTGDVCTDPAPSNHEEPPATPSNALNGVNVHYFDYDDHSEYLHLEGPDLSLDTPIQDSSLEASGVSERHSAHVVLEPGPENPSRLGFYTSCVQAEDGDRNGSAQPDCSHSSPEKDFSGPLIAAETDDISHDLDLKISPKFPEVEDDQTLLSSPHSSAIAAAKQADSSEANALSPDGLVNIDSTEASIMEEESLISGDDGTTTGYGESIENSIRGQAEVQMDFGPEEHQGLYDSKEVADTHVGKLDNEHETETSVMEEEASRGEFHSGSATTTSYGERQERIDPGQAEVQLNLEHQDLCISEEGADTLEFNSTELRENNVQDMSSTSRDVEVPGRGPSQIHGEEEFQEDERISASAAAEPSHRDVNMSEVDDKEPSSSPVSVTLEDCSASDDNSVYASADKSLPKGVYDESDTLVACTPEDDTIPDEFDAESEVISTASLDVGTEASPTDVLGNGEVPIVFSAEEVPLNEVDEFDRHDQTICEIDEESSVCGDDHSKVGSVVFEEQNKVELDSEGKIVRSGSSTEDQWDPLQGESSVSHGRVNPCPTQDADARGDTTDQDLVIDEASSIASATPSELTEHHDPDLQEIQFLQFGTSVFSGDQADAPIVKEKALSDAHIDEEDPPEDGHAIKDTEITSGNSGSQGVPLTLRQDAPNADDESVKEDIIPWKGDANEESLELNLSLEEVVDNEEMLFILSDQDTSSLHVNREEYSRAGVYLNGEPVLSEDEEKVVFSPKNSNGCAFLGPDAEITDISETTGKDEGEDVTERSLLEVDDTSDGADDIQIDPIADDEKEHTFLKDEDMAMESSKDSAIFGVEQSNSSWNSSVCKKEDVVEDEENGVDNVVVQGTPETRVFDVSDIQNHSCCRAENDELESCNGSYLEEESMLKEGEDTVVYRSMESLVESGQCPSDSTPLLVDEKADPEEVKLNGEVVSEVENTSSKPEEERAEAQRMVMDNHEELPLDVEIDTDAEALMVSEEIKEAEKTLNEDIVEKESLVEMVDHSSTSESCTAPNADAEGIDVVKENQRPSWKTDEEGEASLEDRPTFEEKESSSTNESFVISDEDRTNAAIFDVHEKENQSPSWRTDEEGEALLEDRPTFEEKEASSTNESLVISDEDSTNTAIFDVHEKENQRPSWRTDEEGEALVEDRPTFEEEEASSPEESFVISDEDSTNAAIFDVHEKENQRPSWRTDEEGEALVEDRPTFEEEEASSPEESFVTSDEDSTNAAIFDVHEKEIQPPTWSADEEGEASLEDRPTFEEEEASSPEESFVTSHEEDRNADISDADEGESNANRNLEEETVVQLRDRENSSSGHVLACQFPGSVDELPQSDNVECHSKTEGGVMTSDKDAVDTSEDAAKAEEVKVSGSKESIVISHEESTNADHISDAAEGETPPNANLEEEAVVQLKDQENSSSDTLTTVCQVPGSANESLQNDKLGEELVRHSNGAMTSEKDAADISKDAVTAENSHTDHVDEAQTLINQDSEPLALVKETWMSNLEHTPQGMDSPDQELPQALYPLQPPFSGSKQDHLWEEQAEAYSSGGLGTPKAAVAPSSSEALPFSCDDQIQPAASGNPPSKEKLHTPLRSLLLEDAHKAVDGGGSSGSPSFIRRLFRVKSTPSRAPSERDLSQSKLKKSSSMWVSCLGSPQVKQ